MTEIPSRAKSCYYAHARTHASSAVVQTLSRWRRPRQPVYCTSMRHTMTAGMVQGALTGIGDPPRGRTSSRKEGSRNGDYPANDDAFPSPPSAASTCPALRATDRGAAVVRRPRPITARASCGARNQSGELRRDPSSRVKLQRDSELKINGRAPRGARMVADGALRSLGAGAYAGVPDP